MTAWAPGALAPRPGAAPLPRMLAAQTVAELKLVLRNGEQVLLSLVIPLGLLVVLVTVPFIPVDGPRADFFVPGVLALAVMSTAMVSLGIATGFERRYGVLKRLGVTITYYDPRIHCYDSRSCGAEVAPHFFYLGIIN